MNRLSIQLRSRCMMTTVPVQLLLPAPGMGESPADFYGSGEAYKVLYLLHGAGGDQYTFLTDGLNALLRGSKTVVVMPYGINSDYANHLEFGTGYRFTDFFFEELMPFVTASFSVSARPEDTYVAGYSMGGAGALLLGLLHPERFAGIGALGSSLRESDFLRPYLDLTGSEFRAFAEANRTLLPTEFGDPRQGITPKEINMIARYPTIRAYVDSEECTGARLPEVIAAGTLRELYFCCGDRDGCYAAVQRNLALARSLNASQVTCDILPGLDHGSQRECTAQLLQHFGL